MYRFILKVSPVLPLTIIFLIFSGCANSNSFTKDEAKIIVDRLLIFRPNDSNVSDQLDEIQRWQSIFIKYSSKLRTDPREQDIRNYLFLVFVANAKNMSLTLEQISDEIVELFSAQSQLFLSVLAKSQFLVASTCESIGSGFQMYESQQQSDNERSKFIAIYGSEISIALARNKQAEICLSKIEKI
jgi:hypothetical protein